MFLIGLTMLSIGIGFLTNSIPLVFITGGSGLMLFEVTQVITARLNRR